MIDPWYLHNAIWPWATGNQSTIDALVSIYLNLKSEIEDGRVKIHVGYDHEVLPQFADQYFDWVYVDSSHAYEQTKVELALLESKIKSGGLITGDDWRPDPAHKHHGVYKAVQEFMVERGYDLIHEGKHGQWAIKKSER